MPWRSAVVQLPWSRVKTRLSLLAKLLVLVSLILASMPSGATETVCVVGSEKKVVAMRKCGMPCCAHKPRIETPKAACCKPKAAPRTDLCGTASLSCHCETRYVATCMPGPVAAAKLSLTQFELGLPEAPLHFVGVTNQLSMRESSILESDVDPPRKVPRASMRGRAPPRTVG